jgi:hypothetical protein
MKRPKQYKIGEIEKGIPLPKKAKREPGEMTKKLLELQKGDSILIGANSKNSIYPRISAIKKMYSKRRFTIMKIEEKEFRVWRIT